MLSRFPRTACTWPPEDSTARSGCMERRTARWKRASCRYRSKEVRNDEFRIQNLEFGIKDWTRTNSESRIPNSELDFLRVIRRGMAIIRTRSQIVPGIGFDGLGLDGFSVEALSTAGDHRLAATRRAEGQALHADAHRQEPR